MISACSGSPFPGGGSLRAGNDLTQVCGGAADCSLDQVAFFAPGEYFVSVQAFDTSGQASELNADWVEVMGDPDQPPAVADQDIDLDLGTTGDFGRYCRAFGGC